LDKRLISIGRTNAADCLLSTTEIGLLDPGRKLPRWTAVDPSDSTIVVVNPYPALE
jgi:hypothetical protein